MRNKYFLEDVRTAVFMSRGLWFPIITVILTIVAFLMVWQGPDLLVCILEDAHRGMPGTLIGMIIGVAFWSIALEFVTRLIIYLSDNSGKSISPGEVNKRKAIQKTIPLYFLYAPVVIMILALIRVIFISVNEANLEALTLPKTPLVLAFIALFAVGCIFYLLYNKEGIARFAEKFNIKWLALTNHERNWTNKLYGIFSKYRVDISTPYPPDISEKHYDLPRNRIFSGGFCVPEGFTADKANPYKTDSKKDSEERVTCAWMFSVPNSFFPHLTVQVRVFTIFSAVLIAIGCILPVETYILLGTPVLYFIAFGSWLLIYLFLHYLDRRYKWFPFRFTALLLVLISSYINLDHPARTYTKASLPKRPELDRHFRDWQHGFAEHMKTCKVSDVEGKPPVFIISAEGGALRTGAFVGLALDRIQDKFDCFHKHIYCISSVSGGTVGANFFHAQLLTLDDKPAVLADEAVEFFSKDYLAPIIGRMLYGEIINYFIPCHIAAFDRAIALEQSWELGWRQLSRNGEKGKGEKRVNESRPLEEPLKLTDSGRGPLVLINTMEVETGLPCIYSNADVSMLPLGDKRDLIVKTDTLLPYSTAMSLSARFPFFSPAGALKSKEGCHMRHYVDGGYFENKGIETLYQVIGTVKGFKEYELYLLQFGYDSDTTPPEGVRFLNEPAEIFTGLVKARSGRSQIASHYITHAVNSDTLIDADRVIDLPLPLLEKEFPMNWILSQSALDRLKAHIDGCMKRVGPKIESLTRLEQDK